MVQLILPIVGTGNPGDPRRVRFPTWTFVEVLPDGLRMIVDVPAADVPDGLVLPAGVVEAGRLLPPDPSRLTVTNRRAWGTHLDGRYAQHAGEFRPGNG